MKFSTICLVIIAILVTSVTSLHGQTEVNISQPISWSKIPTIGLTHYADEYGWTDPDRIVNLDYKNSVIQIDKGLCATVAAFEGSKSKAVIAFKTNMDIVWKTEITGIPLAIGKFKQQLLVITADGQERYKGMSNSYTAWLINPGSGNLIKKNNFYKGKEDFREEPVFLYAPDGSYVKVGVRKTSLKKQLKLILLNKVTQQFYETQDFTVYDLTDKLVLTNPVKPTLSQGKFGGAFCNNTGELFIRTLESNNTITVSKYEKSQLTPVKQMRQETGALDEIYSFFEQSKIDPDKIYIATTYKNKTKEKVLSVSVLNFNSGEQNLVTEIFTNAHVKDLVKLFEPVNHKMGDHKFGNPRCTLINEVYETSGNLIVALSTQEVISLNSRPFYDSYDYLMNIYDAKLSVKHQQIIPRYYSQLQDVGFGISLHAEGNKLYIATNNNKGPFAVNTLFGVLDLPTGKIISLNYLDKKAVKGTDTLNPTATLWNKQGFTLDYMEIKRLIHTDIDIHVQQFAY